MYVLYPSTRATRVKTVLASSEARTKSLSGLVTYAVNTGMSMITPLVPTPILDAANNLAKAFGFDMPRDLRSSAPVIAGAPKDFAAGSGLSGASMLSKYPDSLPGCVFSSTVGDDMSLVDLAAQESILSTFSFNNETRIGSTFASFPVNAKYPGDEVVPTALHEFSVDSFPATWLSIISQPFTRWRGTLHYKLVFVASAFHTARIRIYFVPGENDSFVLPVIPAVEYWSEIVEISGNTEHEFSIPYLFPLPYSQQSIGRLCFQMVVAPALVGDVVATSAPIDTQLWVRGGADMEWVDPSGRYFVNVLPRGNPYEEEVIYEPQSSLTTGTSVAVAGGPYTNEPVSHLSQIIHAPESYTRDFVGASSIDPTWHSFNRILSAPVNGAYGLVIPTNLVTAVPPYSVVYADPSTHLPEAFSVPLNYSSSMVRTYSSLNTTVYSMPTLAIFSSYYWYWRGGIRYHLTGTPVGSASGIIGSAVNNVVPSIDLSPVASSFSTSGYAGQPGGLATGYSVPTVQPRQPYNSLTSVAQVEVPWKSTSLFASTRSTSASTAACGAVVVSGFGAVATSVSAADDFRFILPRHPGNVTLVSPRNESITYKGLVTYETASTAPNPVYGMWQQVMLY
jgi:hypothetical protein